MARNHAHALTSVNEPTWVYHVYCKHGGLLYVGVARDVRTRVAQHRSEKKWWREEVFEVIASLFPTRLQALEVEAHAIKMFRPAHNIAGQASMEPMPHEVSPHTYSTVVFLNARGVA